MCVLAKDQSLAIRHLFFSPEQKVCLNFLRVPYVNKEPFDVREMVLVTGTWSKLKGSPNVERFHVTCWGLSCFFFFFCVFSPSPFLKTPSWPAGHAGHAMCPLRQDQRGELPGRCGAAGAAWIPRWFQPSNGHGGGQTF